MAETFVQKVEGQGQTSIGNQQTVTRDRSYINTAVNAVDSVLTGVDIGRTAVGKSIAKDAVQQAQLEIDSTLRDQEDLAALQTIGDDPSVSELARKAALVAKGVEKGTMNRGAAELLMANEVKSRIQSNPLFADKIREAATNILGFNPESRAVRQFFGAIDPAGTTTKTTKFDRDIANLVKFGGHTPSSAAKQLTREMDLASKGNIADLELQAGVRDANTWLGTKIAHNSPQATDRFLTGLRTLEANGEDIDAAEMKRLINEDKLATKNALLTGLTAANKTITPEITANIDAQLESQYANYTTIAEGADSLKKATRDLDMFKTMQEIAGVEALPRLTAMNNILGERLTERYMEIIQLAGGNEQELENLFKNAPALREVHRAFSGDLEGFPKLIDGVMQKLQSGTVTNPDGTPNVTEEEVKVLDGLQNTLGGKDAPPEQRSALAGLLADVSPPRASQVILGSRAGLATAKDKAFVKNRWNTLSGAAAHSLIKEISEDSNKSLELTMTPNGLSLTRRALGPAGVVRIGVADTQAGKAILELNKYLQATSRGWGPELGITDPFKTGSDIVSRVNTALDTAAQSREATKAEDTAAREARTQQRREAVTTGQQPAVDLRSLEQSDPDRFSRLQAEAQRRLGAQ